MEISFKQTQNETNANGQANDALIYDLLKKYFGFDSFRACQKEIIDTILTGRDTLAVTPTGSGKSICYYIPSLIFEGITIVVSPLISLMQDQVSSLNDAGIPATCINSSISDNQILEILNLARSGRFKLIYVAPERLSSRTFNDFAKSFNVSMVVVDEAHCASMWGQDFRPDYLRIVSFVNSLPKRAVVSAFTATATMQVRDDIIQKLGLNNPQTFATGFDRPNLYFEVDRIKEKSEFIKDYITSHNQESGIIYCATRKNTDELAEYLSLNGIKVAKYHAGMSAEQRKLNQEAFIKDELPVIVATNAFGMGIDKSNVRFVIHYNMPQSIENYYQEAGRSGRDGESASCILLFSPQNTVINRFLINNSNYQDDYAGELKNNDIIRLKKMEAYCKTTKCLRSYILEYFNDTPTKCDNCSNCTREYEQIDVTEDVKKIFNCIMETHSRYAQTTIAGILTGSNRSKLREIGANSLKSFGLLAEKSEKFVLSIISSLLEDGYLDIINLKYNVLGLNPKTKDFRNPEFKYYLNQIKETKQQKVASLKTKKDAELTPQSSELFEMLRELRHSIATENDIPPYIVFSDKTLKDMCVKMPTTKEQMLNVSGVGAFKYEKYGKQFFYAINRFVAEHPDLIPVINKNEVKEQEEVEPVIKKVKKEKEKFSLTQDEVLKLQYQDIAYISDIRNMLNEACSNSNMQKLTFGDLNKCLVEKRYIYLNEINGDVVKKPTSKGLAAGLTEVEKISQKDNTKYTLIQYPKSFQKEIAEYFVQAADNKN